MLVIAAVTSLMLDDLTRPEVTETEEEEREGEDEDVPMITIENEENDGEDIKLTKREEDRAVRESTSGFPDWISNFFRQVLIVFEALPEPGKNNKAGGKMEEQMNHTLIVRPSLPSCPNFSVYNTDTLSFTGCL